jgi:NADPH-dependent 2,4-dienoyl-CoA reductase/sulfur reductase-like enzyme
VRRIVVVGASLAGLRAAEALRERGFTGEVTLVGAEPHLPYNRPPLSKQLLAGEVDVESTALRMADDLDARWLLGWTAIQLDLRDRIVELADGSGLAFDGLVVATGARPRPWPGGMPGLEGVHVLRGLEDALRLRIAFAQRPRVLVVGAGFIGAEVASTARGLGLDVTLVELDGAPSIAAVGPQVGAFLADLHRDRGVDLRLRTSVHEFHGAGRLEAATLTDGTVVPAEVAIVALGAVPNTEWLAGSGLVLDRGLVCDARCVAADGVVAAGDVARWPHPLFDDQLVAVGHWSNAVEQAAVAAANLLAAPEDREPHAAVPSFWSDQHGHALRSVGLPALADEARVAEGSYAERRFVVAYGRRGRLVGALAVDLGRRLRRYRALIADRAPLADALDGARARSAA